MGLSSDESLTFLDHLKIVYLGGWCGNVNEFSRIALCSSRSCSGWSDWLLRVSPPESIRVKADFVADLE